MLNNDISLKSSTTKCGFNVTEHVTMEMYSAFINVYNDTIVIQ